jgi:hypothetical protein
MRTLDAVHPFRRAGRRTNLALLALLMLALASGVAAFAVGNPGPATIIVVTHGVAGLALAVLVAIVLSSGLLHTLGGFRQVLGLTPMQVHVGGAVMVLAVLLVHLKVHPTRPRRTDASRRVALGGLTLAATAGLAYALLESAGGLFRLPSATVDKPAPISSAPMPRRRCRSRSGPPIPCQASMRWPGECG